MPAPAPRSNNAVEVISVPDAQGCRIKDHLTPLVRGHRLQPDRDGVMMLVVAFVALRAVLGPRLVSRVERFGTGNDKCVLLIKGLPSLDDPPPTPVGGFGDDTPLAMVDALLLGVLALAKLTPIAYAHEGAGRLMRDVLASLASRAEISSHGFKLFNWHIDNPAGPFESESWPGSPIPHYLAFHCVRNKDASGQPVPTDVLPVRDVLVLLTRQTHARLRLPEFRMNPPASNHLKPLEGVPLLVDGAASEPYLRYDGNMDGGIPRVEGLTKGGRAALAELQERIEQAADKALSFTLQPGQVLVFDNYRVLHARREFDPGADLNQARWLRRCYGCQNPRREVYVDPFHSPFVLQ